MDMARPLFLCRVVHTPDLAFVEPGRGPERPVSRAQQGQARQTS